MSINGKDKLQSKFESDCAPFQKLVLKCIEEKEKVACKNYITAYQQCKKEERARVLESNRIK